jgi:signal transduction histidine kinase
MGGLSRRSLAFDVALAAVVVVLGQLEVWAGIGVTHRQGPAWAQALLYAGTGSLLVLRRLLPLETAVGIALLQVAEFTTFGSPEGNGVALAPLIAAYSVARWEGRHRPVWGLVVSVASGLAWIALDPMDTTWMVRAEGLFWLTPGIIGWFAGALLRSRVQAREQDRLRRQESESRAVAEERNRIARELHDVVGHNVSVMTVHAAAVRRRLGPGQETEREAIAEVERTGRETLAEMRRLVSLLRQEDDATALAPAAGLADLDGLVTRFRGAGLPVTVTRTGGEAQLPARLDLAAFRIVQEGLTNVLRHARNPSVVEVRVDHHDGTLRLAVVDDGAAAPGGGTVEAGHGLLGLRERVAIHGGRLVARPRPGRGFELVASLPLEER